MRCAACGRTAKTQCGRCKKEAYCDRDCQAQHWKVHKAVCKPPRRPEVPLCGEGFRAWLARSNWQQGSGCLEEPGVGITNWSNNCYLSAVSQCLLQTPMLRHHLRETCLEPPEDPWLAELLGLCRLIDGAKRKGARYVDLPRRLTRLITEASEEFAFGRQADAHEALMLLISRWLAGCVKVGDGSGADCSKLGYSEKEQLEASSMIGHVFGMLMGSRVACKSCTYESLVTRVEYCLCLTVTLGMTDEELQKCRQESAQQLNRWCLRRPLQGPRSDSSASPTSLSKLLDEYTKEEDIADFKCEKCKKRGASRTSFVRRRPNALVVYIDRRQDTNLFGKINRRRGFLKSW
ncbi:UBP19 [Symbiodinium pilosum]|uniref:ubiquitinyl hydrolase 1 n=1 Tax=Symbiodinium pilosum TaxID=2952 RepID=A0A812J7A5_SYMPI|nr:UBP19 [Symbiodinium pilosum]